MTGSAPLAGLSFALWTLMILLIGVGYSRWSQILTGAARLGDFPGDQPHGSDRYRRIVRAHANCLESLPVLTMCILAADHVGPMSAWFDQLCWLVLGARIAQSVVHISSGSERAIAIRFSFFTLQAIAFCILAGMIAVRWP